MKIEEHFNVQRVGGDINTDNLGKWFASQIDSVENYLHDDGNVHHCAVGENTAGYFNSLEEVHKAFKKWHQKGKTSRDIVISRMASIVTKPTKHMSYSERRSGIEQMISDLERMAVQDGNIAAVWAVVHFHEVYG